MSIPSRPGPGPEQTYISPGVKPPTTIKDYPTLEVTEISLSPCMDAPHALEDSSIIATPKRRRTPSPSSPAATTTSTKTISSSSSSSSSSSTSRHRKSSLHSRHSSSHYSQHRRTATAVSITPITDQTTRREDLLALHRESCRLFQQQQQQQQQKQQQTTPPLTPRNLRSSSTSSNATTTSNTNTHARGSGGGGGGDHSPISIHEVLKTPVRASTLPVWDYTDEVTTTTTPKTTLTVIDWTSPSTRRREYEKIDKASSGMRGFWRRVAPKWCQSRARRMPFFEEKDGKGNYGGSVRRFRMDIPE